MSDASYIDNKDFSKSKVISNYSLILHSQALHCLVIIFFQHLNSNYFLSEKTFFLCGTFLVYLIMNTKTIIGMF